MPFPYRLDGLEQMKWELGEPQSEGLSVTMDLPDCQAEARDGGRTRRNLGLRESWFS
jgi:hypothetical protein